ncbi:YibE/F family protein [Ruficoccus amylovorans]|uniref:YibE/F family protein n=1 Tax=Ruficoccus amylovorans TaxID=1804625 RepID=A0A842HF49_9BACT|nr:YibE/F family protein [Ruficoccus amylovorans]MBC2594197.1 YibE/F family protein [Ruficoccus amylovorans]
MPTPLHKKLLSRDALFCAFFAVLCLVLCFVDLNHFRDDEAQSNLRHHRARVLEADDSGMRVNLMLRSGAQRLQVELLNGPNKGEIITADNMLTGQLALDEYFQPGDDLLLQYTLGPDGKARAGVARGHYRVRGELLMCALFVALLLAVAGSTGAKALLSFAFSALMIWKVMIPLFLDGKNPVLIGMAVVLVLTACICFLVGGLSRRGLASFLGAVLGLAVTCVLALFFTDAFRISGAVRPFSETLLYSGFYDLKLTPIFIASIVIGCSGAMMDLSMDIASAMHEIKDKSPALGLWEHIKSGLSVGRAVTGTMTTTLLLAYSSSYITMLMLFASQGMPLARIANINYVAAEFLNIMVGSFGLVTVAPFTALVSGLIWRNGPASNPNTTPPATGQQPA